LNNLSGIELNTRGAQYIDDTAVFRQLNRRFFVDKMPSNFPFIGYIHLILPNARIVDVRRHPLDCGMANFKQIFSRAFTFSYSLEDIGRYYRDYIDLMSHYDDVLPGKIHRVTYEQLVENPEREVRALLNYVGVSFESACLKFYENTRAVRTASSEQVRMPLFTEGIGSWQKYERHLGPLKEALGPALSAYPASLTVR
jgi:hypothetical protein